MLSQCKAVAYVLAGSLAMVLTGCSGEDVEKAADATGRGMERTGGAIESGGHSAGKKLEDMGKGTKVEKATEATGHMLEKGGEKPTNFSRKVARRSRKPA